VVDSQSVPVKEGDAEFLEETGLETLKFFLTILGENHEMASLFASSVDFDEVREQTDEVSTHLAIFLSSSSLML